MKDIININSIGQIHSALGIKAPKHPLVSIIQIDETISQHNYGDHTYVFDFYQVSLKIGIEGTIRYGRNSYDYQEGTLIFTKPGQALTFSDNKESKEYGGWVLLFHPDLIRKSHLSQKINQYSFFSYDAHEALHISDEEKDALSELTKKIEYEYNQNIDQHTQNLIVSNIELLLNYCVRYYDRQFYFRTNLNQDLVAKLDTLLSDYFTSTAPIEHGLPSVAYCAEQLHVSTHYLSDLLRKETGKSAQAHIKENIMDQARNALLSTNKKISQIAYDLGFEYPQHFSKFFKSSTGMSPKEYRQLN